MKKLVVVVMCIFTIATIITMLLPSRHRQPETVVTSENFSTDFAFDQQLFLSGLAEGQSLFKSDIPALTELIVPHHLLAGALISQGFNQLAGSHPQTVIILSPNHTDIGACPIISSQKSWDSAFGTASVDTQNLNLLLTQGLVCLDDQNMSVEHGIAGLIPYLKYYLPAAKIVPLAFKKNISLSTLDQIAESISNLSDVVVVGSVDFSHGLPATESKEKDQETIKLISQPDTSTLAGLSSQYLDSPAVVITIINIKNKQNYQQIILNHSDASQIASQVTTNDTSYFLLGFYRSPTLTTSPVPTTNQLPQQKSWSLIATGDVMLGRSVNTQTIRNHDFTWAFKNIGSLLSSADLTLINLESPLTQVCQSTDTGMNFCGKAENVQGLVYSGVDIANIANNHIYNQGQGGAIETITLLKTNHIDPVGLENFSVKTIGNTTVAFAGYDATTTYSANKIAQEISNLKQHHSLVVVSFHWGSEYQSEPNSTQISLAHLAIDSGADVVIGTHPHWIQSEEKYKDRPIFYSLGNLIFDQMWSSETKKGMIVRLNYSADKLVSIDHFPVTIYEYGQAKIDSDSVAKLAPVSGNL